MKNFILSLFIIINTFFITSCVSAQEIVYYDEYYLGTSSYPVYYVKSYPYYYYDNTWILIPNYRYTYIRHLNVPRRIHGYRPYQYHYNYRYNVHRRHNSYIGVPHTRQPNMNRTPLHHQHNNIGGGGRFR